MLCGPAVVGDGVGAGVLGGRVAAGVGGGVLGGRVAAGVGGGVLGGRVAAWSMRKLMMAFFSLVEEAAATPTRRAAHSNE